MKSVKILASGLVLLAFITVTATGCKPRPQVTEQMPAGNQMVPPEQQAPATKQQAGQPRTQPGAQPSGQTETGRQTPGQ